MKSKIPTYNLSSEAAGGVYIVQLSIADSNNYAQNLGTHRDDFFILFAITKGKAVMKCDMEELELNANTVVIIKPFQIHAVKTVSPDAAGYYIGVAPFLIPNDCAAVFQNLTISQQATRIDAAQKKELFSFTSLLHRAFNSNNANKNQIINGLFNALVYYFASLYQTANKSINPQKNQSWLIASKFNDLISQYSFLESPSFFAKKLNISTSHLNDCVNAATGKSVTYWLQNAMTLEAQRLLYYSDSDVKEIAFSLGFEDHAYFSRLFKKITQETPLTFRKKFR